MAGSICCGPLDVVGEVLPVSAGGGTAACFDFDAFLLTVFLVTTFLLTLAGVDAADAGSVNCVKLKSTVLLDAVVLKFKTKGFEAEAPPLPAAIAFPKIGRVLLVAGVDLKSKKGLEAEAPP